MQGEKDGGVGQKHLHVCVRFSLQLGARGQYFPTPGSSEHPAPWGANSTGGTGQKLLGTVAAAEEVCSLALYWSCGSPRFWENSSLWVLSLSSPAVTAELKSILLSLRTWLGEPVAYFVEQSSCPSP